jgi:hypothetical protein
MLSKENRRRPLHHRLSENASLSVQSEPFAVAVEDE